MMVVMAGTAMAASETLINGDFETGDFANWEAWNGNFVEYIGTSNVAKIWGPWNGNWNNSGFSQGVAAAEGDVFTLSAEMRHVSDDAITDDAFAVVKIVFKDAGDNELLGQDVILIDASTPVDDWVVNSHTAIAPAGTTTAFAYALFFQPSGIGGGAAHIDNVSLMIADPGEATNPTPADGIGIPAGVTEFSWTTPEPNIPGNTVVCDVWLNTDPNVTLGTLIASDVDIVTNIVNNPGIEAYADDGYGNMVPTGWGVYTAEWNWGNVYHSAVEDGLGNQHSGNVYWALSEWGGDMIIGQQELGVLPIGEYTLSVWLKNPGDNATAKIGLDIFSADQSEWWGESVTDLSGQLTGDWVEYSHDFTVVDGIPFWKIKIVTVGGLWVDDASIKNVVRADLAGDQDYFWRVDCKELNTSSAVVSTTPSAIWTFNTNDVAPTVDAGVDQYVGLDGDPNVTVDLIGLVGDDAKSTLTVTWSDGAHQTDPATIVTINGTDTEVTTVTIDNTGWYEFVLTATDATGDVVDTVNIGVYGSSCEATQANPDSAYNAAPNGDTDGDCDVDLTDLANLAASWLLTY
jgi:hypothetical protein